RRDRDRYIDLAAVLADTHGLEVIDALAAAKLLEDFGFFVEAIGRKEFRDGIADHFLGGVSEHAGGRWIPAADDAVEILGDNCVVGGVDDGLESLLEYGGGADVAGDLGCADDFPFLVKNWRDGDRNGHWVAVLVDAESLNMVHA